MPTKIKKDQGHFEKSPTKIDFFWLANQKVSSIHPGLRAAMTWGLKSVSDSFSGDGALLPPSEGACQSVYPDLVDTVLDKFLPSS